MELDVQQFITHTTRWHTHQIGQLQAVLSAPADSPIQLGTGDEAITLTGDQASGFRAGISLAVHLFGKLPFHIEAEPGAELPSGLAGVPGLQVIDTDTGLPRTQET